MPLDDFIGQCSGKVAEPMIYTITYYTGANRTGADSCTGSMDRARALAVSAVEQGIAQRAEVRDLERRMLYHFPRMACL